MEAFEIIKNHKGPIMVDMLLGEGYDPAPVRVYKNDLLEMFSETGAWDAVWTSIDNDTLFVHPA